jgi:aminoglycoside phosphotransferase (APT) family kinase protein
MNSPEGNRPYLALLQALAPGSRLLGWQILSGGMSAGMAALDVERPDGRAWRLVVRLPSAETLRRNPRAAESEYRLLRLLQASGLPAPRPLFFDSSGAIFPTPSLVLEYVEGAPEFSPANPVDFARRLAETLVAIHRIDGARPDLSFLPRGEGEYAGQVGRRPGQVNQALDEARIRAALEAAWPIPRRNAPVLLHGDFWPGNVLWRAGQLAAVIDWEDARVGDPLLDLSISRLDVLWIFGVDVFRVFTQHYLATTTSDSSTLPYWDLQAALRFIRLAGDDLAGWAGYFAPYGRVEITEETIKAHFLYFIEQAFDKLASV